MTMEPSRISYQSPLQVSLRLSLTTHKKPATSFSSTFNLYIYIFTAKYVPSWLVHFTNLFLWEAVAAAL